MRIMLHDTYEKKLLSIAKSIGLTPSQSIKRLIDLHYKDLDCTIDAQGKNHERKQKEK